MTGTSRIITWGSAILVVGAVVAGLFAIDTPNQERAERRDQARVHDLNLIATELSLILSDGIRGLPVTLEDIQREPPRDFRLVDPWTDEAYGYEALTAKSFRLCATFDTEGPHTLGSVSNRARIVFGPDERHLAAESAGTGLQCFEIDASDWLD